MENGDQSNNILELYIFEHNQLLQTLDSLLLESEQLHQLTQESIGEIFRIIHTLKGSSAMMRYTALAQTAHLLEDSLALLRQNPALAQANLRPVLDTTFAVSDYFKQELARLDEQYVPVEDPALSRRLRQFDALLRQNSVVESPCVQQQVGEDVSWESERGYQLRLFLQPCPLITARALLLLRSVSGLCQELSSVPEHPERHPEMAEALAEKGLLLRLVLNEGATIDQVEDTLSRQPYYDRHQLLQSPQPKQPQQLKAGRDSFSAENGSVSSKIVSVHQDKLNNLVELIGELVTTQSMLEEQLRSSGVIGSKVDSLLTGAKRYLAGIQNAAMALTMVEIDTVFFRMRRIVRDMAGVTGKQVKMICRGGSVALDKSMIEALSDPLMHIVRNAIDHGLESPAERLAAKKTEQGSLILEARSRNDEVIVTVSDDGRGIDRQAVLRNACQNGVIAGDGSVLSDKEVYSLIMENGISTKEQVSQYSGRGVGLDAAREQIVKIGGTIHCDSVQGAGSTFTIRIPATLSIMEGLEVPAGDSVLVFPITAIGKIVSETMRRREALWPQLGADGLHYITYQEQAYPLIDLRQRLCGQEASKEGTLLLVRHSRGQAFLMTDGVGRLATVVVKPLPDFLKKLNRLEPAFVGCTILADGRIGMVVDSGKLLGLSQ